MKELLYRNYLLLLLIMLSAGCSGGDSNSDPTAATFNLEISLVGPGTGTVISAPDGINCGSDCSESFTENTVVTLTASRSTGSLFGGWSGACSGSDTCSVTMDAAKSVTATFIEYLVDCSTYPAYSPGIDPFITPSPGATTTIIIMHGKAGMPDDIYLLPLYSELSIAGYDVIAPYMPWRETTGYGDMTWDGSMCEAMNYVDSLAAQEAAKGNNVIIAGHSMGGAHALIYAATSPPLEVKAIITLAPGHFPQLEMPLLSVFEPVIAASITTSISKAEDMVANGNGDQLDTFDTLFPDPANPLLLISATANHYLSYHALYQYPDIHDVLPTIKLPVLWLAGADDELTTFYNMPLLFNEINSTYTSYESVTGDHLGMASGSGSFIVDWLLSLGL